MVWRMCFEGEGAQDRRWKPYSSREALVDADLDTLATALYVFTDDVLRDHPEQLPPRPAGGIAPKLSDAELLTLAVLQALLGFTSEHRWIRYAHTHLRPMFPQLPQQPGYNKRLRRCWGLLGRFVVRVPKIVAGHIPVHQRVEDDGEHVLPAAVVELR
jgi:hypothetical protein